MGVLHQLLIFTGATMFSLKERVCRGMPKPVSREESKAARKELIRGIVSDLSRRNVSLQQGNFITSNDLEWLRSENQQHDFCGKMSMMQKKFQDTFETAEKYLKEAELFVKEMAGDLQGFLFPVASALCAAYVLFE